MISTKPKIKICYVLHGIVGGGAEQVLLNYCSKMTESFQFDLIYQYEPNKQILERFEKMGFNCIQIPEKTKYPFKHLLALFRFFKKNKYDIVHSHLDWYMNSYVCLLAKMAGVPKRLAHHHQAYNPTNIFVKVFVSFLQMLTRLFSTHHLACGTAAAISGYGKSFCKKNKVTIIDNAIDTERFRFDPQKRDEIRAKLGIGKDTICIGHVGRFYPQKNHEFLINTFYKYHKRNANSILLLIGDGPLLQKAKEQTEQLNISDSILFAGIQKDTAPYYSAMDAFCFPSLWEGLPLVLVEVEYNALPALVSDRITSEVQVTENMKYLSLEDADKWQNALARITPRTNAEAKINSDKFDIDKAYKNLKKIYLE